MQEIPTWIPYLTAGLTALAFILRKLHPLLELWSDTLRRSKIDDMVFDVVEDLAANQAAEINAKIADGTFTRDEGRQQLVSLGKNAVSEILEELGEHFIGPQTKSVVTKKLEKAVSAVKARDAVAGK